MLPACEQLGIGFLPFAPLVRGLLAASLTAETTLEDGDLRAGERFPRVGPEHRNANAELAAVVTEIAAKHGASSGQVALAWLLARRPWIVPIPGTKRIAYVEENAGATALTLSAEDERRLDTLADSVSGDRYGAGGRTPDWVSRPLPVS
jgi:aryl-alcohol dehydrogenase-like predicted oxidoreductase